MASSSGQNKVIHPVPEDPSLLRLQNIHVSEHIWDGQDHPILKFPLDLPLITALVERWRPETHTFHLPPSECTITLQDISVLLGLRIDGRPVIAPIRGNYDDIVEESLGIRPSRADFVGSFLKTSWLDQHFTHVAMHAQNPLQITRFARAYMLRLFGSFMLSDHSSSRISVRYLLLLEDFAVTGEYSWGSTILGFLYGELYMATNIDKHDLGGMAALLVMWACDKFPVLAPGNPPHTRVHLPYATRWLANQRNRKGRKDISYYRYKFDILSHEKIIWQPYSIDLINALPPICREGMDLWRAVVPLPDALHDMTLRGKTIENWQEKLRDVLDIWERRRDWV
ncbi:serine/threonine-protein phosphatase 7 long form homolog [Abrus precatorius]|uniref:Serine/threonine-protein phosphatase 7 long form homolog n=1 Tax=Abrus precatorius TaxID=3816 RepID=A0A8B8M9G3_ABRPR|nr:serine/threonine-protein phosphatase 7 long form homolog [Abrus precatorius]